MSLQAKIEAVVYASEEPVTLSQLMGLLGEEAQAELDALDARQGSLLLEMEDGLVDREDPAGEASGDEDALNAEVLEDAELEREAPGTSSETGAPVPGFRTREDEPTGVPETRNSSESAETLEVIADASKVEAPEAGSGAPESEVVPIEASASDANPAGEKKAAREKDRRLREYFRSLLDQLIAEYAGSDRGLEIREVAGGFRMATKPEYHDAVRGFVKSLKPPLKLSLQALETLAVIAYKQPVTAPEISEIRGVESAGVLGTLVARKLIGTAGRKAVIGRPMLYKTTKEFLLRFGLKDINELPSIEEFEKMAGELNDPVQEEIPMSEAEQASEEAQESKETPERGSPSLDELNSAPGNSDVAESVEEAVGPRDSGTQGSQTEPSSGVSQQAAAAVEQSRDVHEPQADGVPDTPATDTRAIDNHEPYTGSDETGA